MCTRPSTEHMASSYGTVLYRVIRSNIRDHLETFIGNRNLYFTSKHAANICSSACAARRTPHTVRVFDNIFLHLRAFAALNISFVFILLVIIFPVGKGRACRQHVTHRRTTNKRNISKRPTTNMPYFWARPQQQQRRPHQQQYSQTTKFLIRFISIYLLFTPYVREHIGCISLCW